MNAKPTVSAERAEIMTEFYQENDGRYSIPVMRARAFYQLCERKTIFLGEDELIVGERGPAPKVVPTFPELTCHSVRDLQTLNDREKVWYRTHQDAIESYRDQVIPYWQGRSVRDKVFSRVPRVWRTAYEAGVFTEFMEQRAPGHTTLDGKIYVHGMLDSKREIRQQLKTLDFLNDPEAMEKAEQLEAMSICCDAVIRFAERHADLAEGLASRQENPERRRELIKIAEVCRRVPAKAPRDFWEAIQMYWFVHLGTITELNGWDAMNPGHLDQHLFPFFERDVEQGKLDGEQAKELLQCLWVKFNNHPAPPKVGVTAEESGTYNDFTNINLGGLTRGGRDGVNELSYLILEVIDEMHMLQPGSNVQISRKTPAPFLKAACRVVRKGYGYPSFFNADAVVAEQVRAGKSIEDAREGGTSGCVETGSFGKEAYVLTGYLNVPKILEITLNNGQDPLTGKKLGLRTGDPAKFDNFEELCTAFAKQIEYFVDLKVTVNQQIESIFARYVPAPFLSVVIEDCIKKGKDYNSGGARYNTSYIQCCGIGTVTDSLSAIKTHVFDQERVQMGELLEALEVNFAGFETLRRRLSNKTPRFGNDDDRADSLMQKVYEYLFTSIDGRPNLREGRYHLNMLSTTCHVYFGSKLGASPDGRLAGLPESDGTSPSQGADRHGPTAVCRSLSKMDQVKSGGTLLNQRFLPHVLEGETGIEKLAALVRGYFRLDGHHIQFNVVDSETLREAQRDPDNHRDLLVRVAGYSDYFCDLSPELQEEVISRTAQGDF